MEMFTIVTGNEKYKVVDLDTGGETYFDEKLDAYKFMAYIVNVLGHHYRLEVDNTNPERREGR